MRAYFNLLSISGVLCQPIFYPPLLPLPVLILFPATEATAESNSFHTQELTKFSNGGGVSSLTTSLNI